MTTTLYRPFLLTPARTDIMPIVVGSPHSGCLYPKDFRYSCPTHALRQAEDFAVDKLLTYAPDAGASMIAATFPRSYIDLNRAEDDIDPAVLATAWPTMLAPSERTLLGLGLVRRLCKTAMPVYDAPLSVADLTQRIMNYYRPYHAALGGLITECMQRFDGCLLMDMHSMPSRTGDTQGRPRADFVLGDRQGNSCDPALTRYARDLLQDLGYSVALNDPYKGMEIARRYGQPANNQHVLQIEINRALYMNEDRLELIAGFAELRDDLGEFFTAMGVEMERQLPDADFELATAAE